MRSGSWCSRPSFSRPGWDSAMTAPKAPSAAHPSVPPGRTGLFALLYGLVAAPIAWVVSQIANSTLAQEACFPGSAPLTTPAFYGVHAIQAAVLLAALAVSG